MRERQGACPRLLFLLLAAVAGALLALAAERLLSLRGRQSAGADVLASVDGHPITVAAFEYEMVRRGGSAAAFADVPRRRALLDEMLRTEIMAANARRAGYADEPDFGREITHLLAGRYQQHNVDPEVAKVAVGDDEVQAFYEKNLPRFAIPEARHAALILFELSPKASAERKREVSELAERVRTEAQAQDKLANFGLLAMHHSADQASRYRGGDVGWEAKGSGDSRLDAPVRDALFALPEPGTLSPLIETPQGLYLLRLLETKPESVRPLAEVKDAIHRQLLTQKREQRLDELHAAARRNVQVEVDERRLAAMPLPTPQATTGPMKPPPLPQG